jgi:hypothetical protein
VWLRQSASGSTGPRNIPPSIIFPGSRFSSDISFSLLPPPLATDRPKGPLPFSGHKRRRRGNSCERGSGRLSI